MVEVVIDIFGFHQPIPENTLKLGLQIQSLPLQAFDKRQEEEMKGCKFLTVFLYLSCFVALKCNARKGNDLDILYEAKLNGAIDTKLYTDVEIAVEEDENFGQSKVENAMVGERNVGPLPEDLKTKDKIDRLPGQPGNIKFAQYGGYVHVNETAGRAFYYYFVEAETNKESKPLILWLNGGPGCSSLGYGAMQEIGPFRVASDGKKLRPNPDAWNNVANILFVESPAGVGFSYSNTKSDYQLNGDRMTVKDNYAFLLKWFKRFPEYKTRDFYLAGESYAGHYIPELAQSILKHNEYRKRNNINLKGIIIGNPIIDDDTDKLGVYDFYWNHALISDETIADIHRYCKFSSNATYDANKCKQATDQAEHTKGPLNPYNIYAPVCFEQNVTRKPHKPVEGMDPCIDLFTKAYFNTPEVQAAIHADGTKLFNNTWELCGPRNVVGPETWKDSPTTVLPLFQELLDNGLRVWVFSGDMDAVVPVTSTRYALKKLNLPIKTPYYPWIMNEEVGGYSEVYNVKKGDLTFATVRGAGHEVPSYEPGRAFALIMSFLDGTPLPQ